MSILNVVQPDELDGQSFELINDKLEVRISGRRNNGLELKDDGLFTPGNSDKGVPNRFVYLVGNGANTIVHKNVTFDLRVIDGGLNGTLRSPALQYNDTITYDDGSIWSKDITDQIELKWGLESYTRIIFRFHNGKVVPSLWVLRIHRSGFGGPSLLIIDEMTNVGGDGVSNNPELPQAPPEGDITILGYCRAVMDIRTAIIGRGGNRIGIARVEGEDGSVSIADTHFGTLAVNYNDPTNQNIKAYMGYCPLLGFLLYHDGKNYNLMLDGKTPTVTDLPNPDFNTGTAGVGLSVNNEGEGPYIYSMDAQSFSYQRILDKLGLDLSSVTTIDAPTDGIIKDYLVSGAKVAYLLIKNGMYVLHITDLHNSGVTEYPLMPYNGEDLQAKLINGSLGSVFVYIDKVQEQVLVGVVATLDMSTYTLNMTQVEPTVLDGPLLSIDPLSHVSFHLDQTFSSYGMLLSPADMSVVRIGSSLMAGGVEVAKAPIPANYLSLLMSGKMSVPFTGGQTTIAYDASPDGRTISFEELEIGAAGGVSQGAPIAVFGVNEDLAFINTMGLSDRSMGIYAYETGVGISTPNLLTPHEVKETSLIFGADKGMLAYVTQEGSVRLIHEGGNGFIETTLGTIPITPQNISDINNGTYYHRLVIQMVDELTVVITLGNSGEVHVFKCDVSGQNVRYKKVLVQPYQEDIDNYDGEITDYSRMGLSGNRIIISAAVVNDERGKHKRVYVTDIDSGLTVHTYLDDSTDMGYRNIDVIGQNHNHFLTVTEARNDNGMGANVFTLWQINSDLSCSLIVREETVGLSPSNPPKPTNWNGNKIHNFYQFNDRSGWMDVVVNTTEGTINFNVLELTPAFTEAAGILARNGMPEAVVIRVSPNTDEVTTIFIGGGFTVDRIRAFEVQFIPFIPKIKIPKQLVYSAGKARLVADVEPVDGGYSLYRTIGNPGDIVSIFETDIAIDKIANVSSHLAYSYNKDVYAYVKDGWIHVRSLNGNVAPSSRRYTTNARDMEVSQVTIHDGADNLLIAVFVPDTTDTGTSKSHQYQVSYGTGAVSSLGEYRNNLNGTVMSAGIAITDRYVITQVPKNDGTTVVRLNPRDGFGTIVESVTLPISGMERLVSLGGMYFGALMPINMASSEPLMFVTYKVIDSRNIQQVAIHTARYDEFYPNGVGGANKNGQTLDDGRIAFLYTANATADNYGVSGQTFGAFVIDPNTDTVVHQGMVPGGMVDASLNRPLDKMPVCISYGGSLVLECQHSPAELVGTFWMGINPS